MKVFSWNNIIDFLNTGIQNDYFKDGCGISVGCFDGIHKGHRVLLNTLVKECKEKHLKSGIVTFSRPLPSLKHSSDYCGDISSLECRLQIFEELHVDFAIIVDFDDEFSSQLGSDFLNILVNACNMELLAEGVDFRCGYKGATDAQAIKYFGEKNNVKTVFVEPVYYKEGTDEEERISSSYIRGMVMKGFFSTVEELLNRSYEIDISKCNKNIKNNKIKIERNELIQVLPPVGVYRVSDGNKNELRLKIEKDELVLENLDNKDMEISKIVFDK